MQQWWTWIALALARLAGDPGDDVWLERLVALDQVRAVAVADADAARLTDVYVAGSGVLAADQRVVAGYRDRGARVVGGGIDVWWFRVRSTGPDHGVVEVVDQARPARVVWSDGTWRALPRDLPTRRLVTLVRTDDGWRIAGVAAP